MTDPPDSVREEAAKAAYNVWRLDFENEPVEWDALPDGDLERPRWFDAIDAAHAILCAADRQEIARLTKDLEECENVLISTRHLYAENAANWKAENARLTARLAEVEGALRWYADAKNYSDFCPGEMVQTAEDDGEWREDNGQRARAFLANAERP